MKVISVVNQKGGCGKTITAVNLGWAMSLLNYKVLLIDLDPQAHATFSLNLSPTQTITDAFDLFLQNRPVPFDEIITSRSSNLSVFPSSLGLAAIEQKLTTQDDKLELLRTLLGKTNAFDYCIIDCPPNLGTLTINALVASHFCLIPLGMCNFSLRGVELLGDILGMIKNFKGTSPAAFYLLTQFDQRSRFSRHFLKNIKTTLGTSLLKTVIRTNVTLKEAASLGKAVFEHDPHSRGASDYLSLAKEVAKVTKGVSVVRFLLEGSELSDVYIVGDFNGWRADKSYQLKQVDDKSWAIDLPLRKGKYRYKFLANNEWINDPDNTFTEDDTFGGHNSVIFIE